MSISYKVGYIFNPDNIMLSRHHPAKGKESNATRNNWYSQYYNLVILQLDDFSSTPLFLEKIFS